LICYAAGCGMMARMARRGGVHPFLSKDFTMSAEHAILPVRRELTETRGQALRAVMTVAEMAEYLRAGYDLEVIADEDGITFRPLLPAPAILRTGP